MRGLPPRITKAFLPHPGPSSVGFSEIYADSKPLFSEELYSGSRFFIFSSQCSLIVTSHVGK